MSRSQDDNPNRAPWTNENPRADDATGAPRPYDPSQPVGSNAAPRKSGLGCWFWGCLGTLMFTVLAMIGVGFGTYYFLTSQVAKYTDTQAAEIPIVEMEDEELEQLQLRIESFTNQIKSESDKDSEATGPENTAATADTNDSESTDPPGRVENENAPEPVQELVLTATEINSLISSDDQLRGRVFVRIEDGRVFGEVSFPMDKIPGGKGRFFNADAEFDVAMNDGVLEVRLTDANVKGQRIPDAVLEGFAQENLAKDLYKDRENAKMLRKFKSIEVVDDSIVLKLRETSLDETSLDAASTDAALPDEPSSDPPADAL